MMIEKSRAYLEKELRNCFRNKKYAIKRINPESDAQNEEIRAINDKISVMQFLLRCLDAVEMMQEEREDNE